jgi:hypothetical protein
MTADDGDELDFRSLGAHNGFELIASRQPNGWWRVMAVSNLREGEHTSDDRTALVVSLPLLHEAEQTMRERIDRWRGLNPEEKV